jgi:ActR/RegA family two-component response regulator
MPELFLLNKDTQLSNVLERYLEKTGHAAEYVKARQETLDELVTNLRKEVGAVPGRHVLLGGNDTKDMG